MVGVFETESLETYEEDDIAGAVLRAFERRAEGEARRASTAASAGWRRTFSGAEHELTADLSLDHTRAERELQATIADALPAVATRGEDFQNDVEQDQARLKVDYNRPMSDVARLRSGYELEVTRNDYDNFGSRGAGAGPFPVDPNLTNRFLYEQTVHAIYGTYQRPFGRLTAQGGLRLEQVSLDLDQITPGRVDRSDDLALYPTLHLAYELTPEQQLTASYSLRVQRPRPDDLNPYVVYIDPFNLRSGNPRLEVQQTHSFEAGWQYRRGQNYYLATLYYRASDNGVTDIVRDLGDGVFLTTRENLSERRSSGVELVANGRLSSRLTYNVSGAAFWEEISASSLGFTEPRSGASVSVRGSFNWQPTDRDFFQLSAFLRGRQILPQGYREPTGVLNLGYRRKVDDRLSLVATARDVLGSLQDTLIVDTPNFRDRIERRFNGRAVFVGFTYNFGQAPARAREPGFEFDGGAGGPP